MKNLILHFPKIIFCLLSFPASVIATVVMFWLLKIGKGHPHLLGFGTILYGAIAGSLIGVFLIVLALFKLTTAWSFHLASGIAVLVALTAIGTVQIAIRYFGYSW